MAGELGVVCVRTAALRGVEPVPVTVEISVGGGLPQISIVGKPDNSVLESRSRIRCAFRACGFEMPRVGITVNLTPVDLKKMGTGYDLPIAVGLLVATGQVSPSILDTAIFVGGVGLQGGISPVRGEVAFAELAASQGLDLVVSSSSAIPRMSECRVLGLQSLVQLREGLCYLSAPVGGPDGIFDDDAFDDELDFADVADQEIPKRAMVIAATGGHGVLMVGPPGAGKSMLAKRLPTILPPLSESEISEALLVHSAAGLPVDSIAAGRRPFRAPHHSISPGGLVGGGRPVAPGEISLAHCGVLFLDELPEFATNTLQSLRQPMEDHEVRLVRVDGVYTFPCNFQLVAAANPCPCGHYGDPGKPCKCAPARVVSYQNKIGGPLMDRIDVVCDVARPASNKVIQHSSGLGSNAMKEKVMQGREYASWRLAREAGGGTASDSVGGARFTPKARSMFEGHAERLLLGGRGIVRVARVSRTIADLAEHELVDVDDVMEALGFRSRAMG